MGPTVPSGATAGNRALETQRVANESIRILDTANSAFFEFAFIRAIRVSPIEVLYLRPSVSICG